MFSERVHCILIVVISMTKDHDKKGVQICDIAREYNIPTALISSAVKRLVREELILTTHDGRFLLSDKMSKLTLCDVVFRFGDMEFSGTFSDIKTKTPLKLSMASRVIIAEQNKLYEIIQNRLQHINLLKWSEKAGNTICL
ncbi:MAG: Rrf2 family transcriptional regulator [Rikenellaceae bacterium]